jgi:hypothetical protein
MTLDIDDDLAVDVLADSPSNVIQIPITIERFHLGWHVDARALLFRRHAR